jgi:hypothetical protein
MIVIVDLMSDGGVTVPQMVAFAEDTDGAVVGTSGMER